MHWHSAFHPAYTQTVLVSLAPVMHPASPFSFHHFSQVVGPHLEQIVLIILVKIVTFKALTEFSCFLALGGRDSSHSHLTCEEIHSCGVDWNPHGLSAEPRILSRPLDKARTPHSPSFLIPSISEPPPAPLSPRMSREEPQPRRHLLEFSTQEPVEGVEPLRGSSLGPEELHPSPPGRPGFR